MRGFVQPQVDAVVAGTIPFNKMIPRNFDKSVGIGFSLIKLVRPPVWIGIGINKDALVMGEQVIGKAKG